MAAPGVGKLENYYIYLQNYLAQFLISVGLFQQILTTSEETGRFLPIFLIYKLYKGELQLLF